MDGHAKPLIEMRGYTSKLQGVDDAVDWRMEEIEVK